MTKKHEENLFQRLDREAIEMMQDKMAQMRKAGKFHNAFDPTNENMTTKSMRDWLEHQPETPELHVIRCLAHILHEQQCYYNHTDGCGWYYYDIDRNTPHIDYMKKAMKLYKEHDDLWAVEVLRAYVLEQQSKKALRDLMQQKKGE